MASFAPIKGTHTQIQNTPIVDGQFLCELDQGNDGKIYIDSGNVRVPIGGGSTALRTLGDVNLSNLTNKDVLQYNSTTEKWDNVLLIDWLRDSGGNIQEQICLESSSDATYEFTNLNSSYGYEAWINCADNQLPPQVKGIAFDSSQLKAYVTVGEVKSAQTGTGGNQCKLRLRAIMN